MKLSEFLVLTREQEVYFVVDDDIKKGIIRRSIQEYTKDSINVVAVDVEVQTIETFETPDKQMIENIKIENFKCELADIFTKKEDLEMLIRKKVDIMIAELNVKIAELEAEK